MIFFNEYLLFLVWKSVKKLLKYKWSKFQEIIELSDLEDRKINNLKKYHLLRNPCLLFLLKMSLLKPLMDSLSDLPAQNVISPTYVVSNVPAKVFLGRDPKKL